MADQTHVPPVAKEQVWLGGRRVQYRVVESKKARSLRLRVGPAGIEVSRPTNRTSDDVSAFLDRHAGWILDQLDRVNQLRSVRRPVTQPNRMLFRGELTAVRVTMSDSRVRGASIAYIGGEILIRRERESRTPVAKSLENWLGRQARAAILAEVEAITPRLGLAPKRVYVMGQRTKWGNCSPRGNLSFNWRLVLAPEFVLHYLVTHEAVHLAVPDHSAKFWLTVQSFCPQTERARQWLISRADELRQELSLVDIA